MEDPIRDQGVCFFDLFLKDKDTMIEESQKEYSYYNIDIAH